MKSRLSIIKISALVLSLCMIFLSFVGCGDSDIDPNGENVTRLSFNSASGYDYLKSLDGTPVSIRGYMATSSPVDGSFMFLMNLPYQSCPFCVPNTSQLSNTMEIYPKSGDSFAYTTQAIQVVGILKVSESENEPFTDKYGYEFCSKIVDATYTVIKAEDLSASMSLWQKIASTDVISEVYRMYDYVNFLCAWNTYYVNSYTSESGEKIPGYYLWASDAERFIYNDGSQYNYGYKEGYFDSLVAEIEAVDKTAFSDLTKNIRDAEALANKALSELKNKNYTCEYKYVEKFGKEDYIYTLNKQDELKAEMNAVYGGFSNWLGSWEL